MDPSRILTALIFVCAALACGPAQSSEAFEIVAEFDQAPGNLTVTPDGRIIMSLHQFYEPEYSVVEVLPNGRLKPFPNLKMNRRGVKNALQLDSVLGIHADNQGHVWMLDNGLRGKVAPKLVAWDTRANKLHRVIEFTKPMVPENAFINDLSVDELHNTIFISDPAGGPNAALVVVDLKSGTVRRVLEGDRSVLAEDIDLIIDGQPIQVLDPEGKKVRPHIGVNPIGQDSTHEWVYYGSMHGRSLFRIRARSLADPSLDSAALAKQVERYSDKPVSDGIAIDRLSNIYLGELATNAIGVVGGDRKYRRLAQSTQLSWVDSLAVGPNGDLYAVMNRLHQSAPLNAGKRVSKPPYYLIRLRPTKLNQQSEKAINNPGSG